MKSSDRHPEIIPPLAFNPYKHHMGFLREKIIEWQGKNRDSVFPEIQLIGNNITDLYYGHLSVEDICNQFLKIIQLQKLHSAELLSHWLKDSGYRKTSLSDTSLWIIRQGENPFRYLHIHPAKYSPNTIRVKAPALKTVLALQVLKAELKTPEVKEINRIRIEKLNLSPIKTLVKEKGLAKLIHYFNTL